jgi:hypothetical protein
MYVFHHPRVGSTAIGLSLLLFVVMQVFDHSHCLDCGARVGFPFAYMQDGTYSTMGHTIWLGLLGDCAIALLLSGLIVWMWRYWKHRTDERDA